jgi:hypothetical protein
LVIDDLEISGQDLHIIYTTNKDIQPKKYTLILTLTFFRTLELDNWNHSLPTSPAVNILNHISLLKNCSLPLIPFMILLQMLNK